MSTISIYSNDDLKQTFNFVHLEQGSSEWLDFKKDKIGASYAAAIMGVDPYRTPLMLWGDMISGKKISDNAAMRRGREEEPNARKWFNEWIGGNYEPAVIQSTEHPDLIASLDGLLITPDGPVILEIKVPGINDHILAVSGQIPEKYEWQMLFQMMISGAKSGWYCSWDGKQGMCIEIKRNNKCIEALLSKTLYFLSNFKERKPPKEIEEDVIKIEDKDLCDKAKRYLDLDNEIKLKVKEKEAVKEEIVACSKDVHPRVSIGGILKVQRVITEGRIDYGIIPELKGLNVDKYRKPSIESWRLEEM